MLFIGHVCSGLKQSNNTFTLHSYCMDKNVHSQIQHKNIYCMHTGNDITSM